MPPKSRKDADKNKDVDATEDPLQAVVLSDSFETRFSPFTLEKPRCLLPLANTPLIEYTLDYLASTGIEEVFVYCSAHTEQIEAYLHASKWTQSYASFRLHILRSTSRSIGDAMRDLDKRAILSNDFIVVYGDVVSNAPLGPALAAHRARRAVDKNAIMTMVLRETGTQHRTKANDMLPAFVVDPSKRRCLHYQQLTSESEGLLLDEETLKQDIEVRTDLVDCGIDICTPDVLALWSDNFDYERPRAGFLHSVLKDYELNGKTIHTHIVNDCYAARVRNLQGYDAVSQDILAGWSYPYVPLTNWSGDANYERQDSSVFKASSAKVSRTAQVGPHAVLGKDTVVGSATRISRSVVGDRCHIGDNCRLQDAYIWDDVTIDGDVEVVRAIVAAGSKIGRGSKIQDGALVSYGVQIPSSTVLGKRKRAVAKGVSEKAQPEGDYDVLKADSDDDENSSSLKDTLYNMRLSQCQESISTLDSEDASASEADSELPSHRASFTSQGSGESQDRKADSFISVNAASIYDSLKQGHDVSTIQLELQSQRMAQNASEHDVRQAVAHGLNRYLLETGKEGGQVVQLIKKMREMFERIVFDSKEAKKEDQVDFLLLCQAEATKKQGGQEVFGNICNGLYQMNDEDDTGIFTDEAFEQWWEDERSQKTDELKRVRQRLEKFIEIILAESESEEEDETDSDE